jgi:hypothetical protein
MTKRISTLIILSGLFFTACQKNNVAPDAVQTQTIQSTNPISKPITQGTGIASTTSTKGATDASSPVTGSLRLQLALDSINSDNILFDFNPTAKTNYVPGEDAPSMHGFGIVSLSSLSSDRVPLAINALPLTSKGLSIALNVNAKNDGVYKLTMMSLQSVPDSYSVYIKDGYKKDSLDLRLYPTYLFNIFKADTASFGINRFKLVIRSK